MKRHLLAGLLLCLASASLPAAEDPEQLKSLKQAAESGNISAQYELGVLYEFGYRMKTHMIPALAWYMVAADNGDARATKRRDYLMAQLTPEQVEEAKRLRGTLGAKKPPATDKPAEDKPAAEPARPAADKPAPAKPAEDAPQPEAAPAAEPPPAKPAEEKPKPAAPAAKPVETKPDPKPESKPAADAPSGDGPTVQPLLPPPSN